MKAPLTLCVSLALVASAGTALADGAWQLTFDPAHDAMPTWSPDGSQIAIQSDRSGDYDIWVIPASGGVATRVTDDPAVDRSPDWSPDGDQIAFQSDRSGDYDIWVVPASGGVATQITTDPAEDKNPTWCYVAIPQALLVAAKMAEVELSS